MRLLAAIFLLAATGCATTEAEGRDEMVCNVEGLQDLIGEPATTELGSEAMRRSGSRRLRWIRPGDVVTMDYSPQRLNVHLDAQNRVERFACG